MIGYRSIVPATLATTAVVAATAGLDCDPAQTAKLTALDGVAFDGFGGAVSISGDVLIVGAELDDDHGDASGSVHLFRHDGVEWQFEDKLIAPDGAEGDQFGFAVATTGSSSGDVVIVGSPNHDEPGRADGGAYVFRHDGTEWAPEQSLTVDRGGRDAFGTSVAIDGDVAVLGGPDYRWDGAAAVFRHDGAAWAEEQLLVADDPDYQDRFGASVSVDGDTIVVGMENDDERGANAGAAHVFRHDGTEWIREQILFAADATSGDAFGRSVSIDGGVAVVGAMFADGREPYSGAAYVFRHDGNAWVQERKLRAADGDSIDRFGRSVSISGDVIVIGADLDDDEGEGAGAAYVFRHDGATWVEQAKLTAADGAQGDAFGWSVAVDRDVAVIGARHDDDAGTNAGSAYVFDLNCPRPCPADLDESGDVGFADILRILDTWGETGGPADLDQSGLVDFGDLLIVLDSWGPCG